MVIFFSTVISTMILIYLFVGLCYWRTKQAISVNNKIVRFSIRAFYYFIMLLGIFIYTYILEFMDPWLILVAILSPIILSFLIWVCNCISINLIIKIFGERQEMLKREEQLWMTKLSYVTLIISGIILTIQYSDSNYVFFSATGISLLVGAIPNEVLIEKTGIRRWIKDVRCMCKPNMDKKNMLKKLKEIFYSIAYIAIFCVFLILNKEEVWNLILLGFACGVVLSILLLISISFFIKGKKK